MEFPTVINWNSPFLFKGCRVVIFIFNQILIEHSASKQWKLWSDAAFSGVRSALVYLPTSYSMLGVYGLIIYIVIKIFISILGQLHITSSATDMLDNLQRETLEWQKVQASADHVLQHSKHRQWIVPCTDTGKENAQATQRDSERSSPPATASIAASFLELSSFGTTSQHQLLMPLTWYSSSRGLPSFYSKR